MTQENKSSFAFLPCYIMDDETLDEGAKILYARISMYSNEGRCWASNQHFAEKQKVTTRCIQKWLAELKEAGYIEVEIDSSGFQTKRNIWLNIDFKNNFTKRTTIHPPLPCSSPTHEPQFVHINTSNTNIKEQQQPAAAGAVFYECLKEIDIPEKEKISLSMRYKEVQVQHAIKYCTHPSTVIKTTFIQTLKWACANQPEIPTSKEDLIITNRSFAIGCSLHNSQRPHSRFTIEPLSKHVEIIHANGQQLFLLLYSENGFKDQLLNAISKARGE